ncbi:MAG: radical SAM protein [Nanoarchaeota archaeon]
MDRDYIFLESTTSICPRCLKRIPAKIVTKKGKVFLRKHCLQHGPQEELLEDDAAYHKIKRDFEKPGTISKTQTKIVKGCPFDCGLCPSHDQHTCIGLIEITNRCNLICPTCYAKSGDGGFLPLELIEKMMDFFIASEGGQAEILQISGGEPSIHPDIIKILKLALSKKFKYVMLNTNGIRIAEDEEFVKALSEFKERFEVYLQFDGFSWKTYQHLRGKDISKMKFKAIKNLRKNDIPMTLVTTVERGVNDKEIGKIVQFGIDTSCIRGVNLQPVAFFGRGRFRNIKKRMTLSGVIKEIERQLPGVFKPGDIIPLPCDVERVAVTYLARSGKDFVPITRKVKVKSYLPLIDNSFAFHADRILKKASMGLVNPGSGCNCLGFLKEMRSIIPLSYATKSPKERRKYLNENTFRISVTSFIDVYNFDMKSMQKECVHIITPDLKKIPFSAYNMFHRK